MSNYLPGREPTCPVCGVGKIKSRTAQRCQACHMGWRTAKPMEAPPRKAQPPIPPSPEPPVPVSVPLESLPELIQKRLRAHPMTLVQLAEAFHVSQGQVLDAILVLRERSLNVQQLGELWSLEKLPATAEQLGRTFEYTSRPDHSFKFGVIADTHSGSKYERLDVVRALYDWFAAEQVDRVFHGGNMIEGEARFNKYDIAIYGLENQVRYLGQEMPQVGLQTFFVHGDDHEGWYGQREAVDIGGFIEDKLRAMGRTDWVNLGFMEGRVELVNASSGARADLLVTHPGGGSAYAQSYKPQKKVESFQGGEKPAVLLLGHYHKMGLYPVRNVWALHMGCCQDQTPFLRKQNIEVVVGGIVVTLRQDPRTGAIIRCQPDCQQFFVKAYYNDRWTKVGSPVLPDRSAA